MNDMYKKVDRRVMKTKSAILRAFAQLLAEKDIDEISIKDISDAADINRKTVYNYYKGIYQIMDDVENNIVSAFDSALSNMDFNQVIENPYLIFAELNTILNSNIELYLNLSKKNSNSNLSLKIISKLKEKINNSFRSHIPLDDPINDLILDYTISGMLTVYNNWFNSDRRQSLEELSKMVSILCFSGFSGVMKMSPNELKLK